LFAKDKETSEAVYALKTKIDAEYESMREAWWNMTPDELIENSGMITAAKFIKENIESCVTAEQAECLASISDPLNTLIESMNFRYDAHGIEDIKRSCNQLFNESFKEELETVDEIEQDEGMIMQ